MPEFRHPDEVQVELSGPGWEVSVLIGSNEADAAMSARRWRVEPGSRTPVQAGSSGEERFLYVISGFGSARVGGETVALGVEDVLWLDPDDSFALEASGEPLEVLEAGSRS